MKNLYKRLKHRARRLFEDEESKRHALVGPANLWKMKREFQERFLKEKGLRPQHRLLDVGCGTLRGGLPLIDYLDNGHYTGIDVRKQAIEEGKIEVKKAGLESKNPALIQFSSFEEIRTTDEFDFVWAFAVLFHLEDDIFRDCIAFVGKRLNSEGRFFANVNLGQRPQGKWREFPVVSHDFEFYENEARKVGLSSKILGSLRECGHQSGDPNHDEQTMLEFRKV